LYIQTEIALKQTANFRNFTMSFKALGLSEPLLKAVSNQGYTDPSPIQEKAIPHILKGRDVLASAQTGTGKTAGFTLPILEILSKGPNLRNRPIQSLILTPTRELAAQVFDNIQTYSKFLDLRAAVIFGGVKQGRQVTRLREGVDILVATPGRLIDLHQQRLISLAQVKILVLDEADRMLDMGFLRDIERIMDMIPAKSQNLMFSATYSKEIKKLASNLLHQPVSVEVNPENSTVDAINQLVYHVARADKTSLAVKLITEGNWQKVLVFTRTKYGADKLSKKFERNGIKSAAIHGNKSQGARTKALAAFKKGSVDVLVATDIAARGLDIHLLPHVINFEIPNIPEDYIHRIGRTGRFGADGQAVSLVSTDEVEFLEDIEKLLGMTIPNEIVEGYEPDPEDYHRQKEKQKTKGQRLSRPRQGREKSGHKKNHSKPGGNRNKRSNSRRNKSGGGSNYKGNNSR
jgi:ATP-dependent RNA helicase RhlE